MANVSFGSASATQVIEAIVKFYNLPFAGRLRSPFHPDHTTPWFWNCRCVIPLAGTSSNHDLAKRALQCSALHLATFTSEFEGRRLEDLSRTLFLIYVHRRSHMVFCPRLPLHGVECIFVHMLDRAEQCHRQYPFRADYRPRHVSSYIDWAQVVYANQSPLLAPFWAGMNVMAGFVMFFWIICPAIYYTNTWYSAYMPLMSSNTFDNVGKSYNTSRIMSFDGIVNQEAYKAYSPMFIPAAYALTYGLSFANLTGIFVHIALYHGRDLYQGWKGTGKVDVHGRIHINLQERTMVVVWLRHYRHVSPEYHLQRGLSYQSPSMGCIPCLRTTGSIFCSHRCDKGYDQYQHESAESHNRIYWWLCFHRQANCEYVFQILWICCCVIKD